MTVMNSTHTNTDRTATIDPMTAYTVQAAVLAKIAAKEADEAWRRLEADAIEALSAVEGESIMLPDGTTVTVKRDTTLVVDLDAAHALLPGGIVDGFTKETVDVPKFRGALAAGLIPEAVAAEITTEKDRKPSLRITAAITAP